MAFYTIHEDVQYEVEAANPAEAMALFLDDPAACLTGVQDRYMTDENGEDRDQEDTEA